MFSSTTALFSIPTTPGRIEYPESETTLAGQEEFQLLRTHPRDTYAWLRVGQVLAKEGASANAHRCYIQALICASSYTEMCEALGTLGQTSTRMSLVTGVILSLLDSLRSQPENQDAWQLLGENLGRLGAVAKSFECSQQVEQFNLMWLPTGVPLVGFLGTSTPRLPAWLRDH
jgi:predicted Zn-dependent protease